MKKRVVGKKSKKFNFSGFKIDLAIFLVFLTLTLFILNSFFEFLYSQPSYSNEAYQGSLNSEVPTFKFVTTILAESTKSFINRINEIPIILKCLIIGVLILFAIVIIAMIKRSEREKIVDKWIDGKGLIKELKKNKYSKETIKKIFKRKGWTNSDIERIIKD
jgi:hypothetical protein